VKQHISVQSSNFVAPIHTQQKRNPLTEKLSQAIGIGTRMYHLAELQEEIEIPIGLVLAKAAAD
jgi:hypothetical protein